MDTGFIVYNDEAYPNLVALFRHLGVPRKPSEMSFAVSLEHRALEDAGAEQPHLPFAQISNPLRPRFWRMLQDLVRFHRTAPDDLAWLERDSISLVRI